MEHSWDIDYRQAARLQRELAGRVQLKDCFGKIEKIAGVDLKGARKGYLYCAILVFSYPRLDILEKKAISIESSYPYVPGLLSFREGPAVLKCFEELKIIPDLVFFDGNGFMHPRRLGLASHMGLLLDLPSIGVAKSKLLGNFKQPGPSRGSYSLVEDKGQIIGAALRTREGTKPVFVSCGHKICLDSAIRFTLAVSRYRIPEPTRQAHNWLSGTF